jgi:hypothetical protein
MLTSLVTVALMAVPFLSVVGLMLLAARWQRGREIRVAQQIAVTEAIHRELGAVVAPSMAKRGWGPPRLVIPIPLEQPGLVAAVLAIAHRVVRGWDGAAARRLQIVVIQRPDRSEARMRRAA